MRVEINEYIYNRMYDRIQEIYKNKKYIYIKLRFMMLILMDKWMLKKNINNNNKNIHFLLLNFIKQNHPNNL